MFYHAAATLYVRVADNRPDVLTHVQAAIRQVTGRPAAPVASEEVRLGTRLFDRRLNAIALDIFASFGLLLAAMGIYATIAYAATQRTREIGIRVALGAQSGDVLRLVLRRGVALAAIGVVLGLAGALAGTRVMASLLYSVGATDPAVYVAVTLLLALVAIAASYVAARRALRVDPMVALRAE